jgi:formylglycine-generating enzyme required for sulfatase activity
MTLPVRLSLVCLLGLALLGPQPASATPRRSLAVLDLVPEGMEMKSHEINLLTDFVRKVAIDEVGHEYDVMTKENIEVLLKAQGKTLEKCSEAACEVEYGQMLGADVVVTGRLVSAFSRITVTIKSHDTATGKLLGADDREARALDDLPDVGKAVSRSLIVGYVRKAPRPGAALPPKAAPAPEPQPEPEPEDEPEGDLDPDAQEELEYEEGYPRLTAEDRDETHGHLLIRGAKFLMGAASEPNAEPDESPQHAVELTYAYWLAKTEVTQGHWRRLMVTNPSKYVSCGDDCPVERVSWWDAIAYANALSSLDGHEKCYAPRGCKGSPGDGKYRCKAVTFVGLECEGYRLPTEAEWEYAARAGRTSTDFERWALDAVAWHKGNSGKRSHRVATRKASAWGLHDMLGSVWEWCHDWAGPYGRRKVRDPVGAARGTERIGRGGSFTNDHKIVRLTNREPDRPTKRYSNRGFRTARTSSFH